MGFGLLLIERGLPKSSRNEDAVGSLSLTELTSITLNLNKVYEGLRVNGHCRTGALFQVIYYNDGIETVVSDSGSDAGLPSPKIDDPDFSVSTVGKSGIQKLILKYKNFNITNCTRGSLSTREFDAP